MNHADMDRARPDVDLLVREQLLVGVDLTRAAERSHHATAARLVDAIAAERTRRARRRVPSRRSLLAVSAGLCMALLVAGALVPSKDVGNRVPGDVGVPFAPANASAAEVLERAAKLVVSEDPKLVGSGPVWHSVQRSTSGEIVETWVDPSTRTARSAVLTPAGGSPVTSYRVENSSNRLSSSTRQYALGKQGWRLMGKQYQFDEMMPTVDTMALHWLSTVIGATEPEQVREANERFRQMSLMTFAFPGVISAESTSAVQTLHLLNVARLEPTAVNALYRDLADLRSLERLGDTTFHGRRAVRLRLMDLTADVDRDYFMSVLLIDAYTGEPLAIENERRTSRTTFDPPGRVAKVGAGSVTCGGAGQPPCSLLNAPVPASVYEGPTMDQIRAWPDPGGGAGGWSGDRETP